MARRTTRKRSKNETDKTSGDDGDVSELLSSISIALKKRGLLKWKVRCDTMTGSKCMTCMSFCMSLSETMTV